MDIFKRASSLSAALSFLLSSNQAQGSIGAQAVSKMEDANDRPFEPLLLKSAAPQTMENMEFAGHRSHSSHSSHYSSRSSGHSSHASHTSHYSSTGTGSYNVTPSRPAAPVYVAPTPRPTPVYVPRAVAVSPSSYVSPVSTPVRVLPAQPVKVLPAVPVRAVPTTPVSRVEFKNGAVFMGHVLVKSGAGITLETQDRTTHKIPRRLLTDATVNALQLPAES